MGLADLAQVRHRLAAHLGQCLVVHLFGARALLRADLVVFVSKCVDDLRAEEMDDEALAEMRGEAMAYLREVREAQLVLSVPEGGKGEDWRKEAIRRWGALAGAGKDDRDWKLFVESRLSTPPPVSPIDFLQEYYVACGVVKGAFDLDARRRVDGVSGANPVTYRRSSRRPPTRGAYWSHASSCLG